MKAAVLFALCVIAIIGLAGCGTSPAGPASIKGECQVFQDPGFAVQGKRPKDQRAIDTQWLEPGIGAGCFKRPTHI